MEQSEPKNVSGFKTLRDLSKKVEYELDHSEWTLHSMGKQSTYEGCLDHQHVFYQHIAENALKLEEIKFYKKIFAKKSIILL